MPRNRIDGGHGDSVVPVWIPAGDLELAGDLAIPDDAAGVVVFAHGSGSSRHSPRNRLVADRLVDAGFATLLFDLLTTDEDDAEHRGAHLRFDVATLGERLVAAVRWLATVSAVGQLPIGTFGASTGAAAALIAAADLPDRIQAVVSRGGRPDLADGALPRVQAPTLLLVGANDPLVLQLNRQALAQLGGPARLDIIPGAGHLFEEPGALDEVVERAAAWFTEHLVHRLGGRLESPWST